MSILSHSVYALKSGGTMEPFAVQLCLSRKEVVPVAEGLLVLFDLSPSGRLCGYGMQDRVLQWSREKWTSPGRAALKRQPTGAQGAWDASLPAGGGHQLSGDGSVSASYPVGGVHQSRNDAALVVDDRR